VGTQAQLYALVADRPGAGPERNRALVGAIETLRRAGDELDDAITVWLQIDDDADALAERLRVVFDRLYRAAHVIVGGDRSISTDEMALRVVRAQVATLAQALGADPELFDVGVSSGDDA